MNDDNYSSNTITFLGTAGARFMVTRQLAASGGIWLNLSGTEILIDPGPGSLVHSTRRKLDAENLSGIILSHRHLDHSADINIMIEAMTNGGFNRHGRIFAPGDAVQAEPVVFSYLKDFIDGIEILQAGKSYSINDITFHTPVRHRHAVETYGLVFQADGCSFAYIADTSYFEGLGKNYTADLLIINTVLEEPRPPIAHLSLPDAARLIKEIRPKAAILTHFGLGIWKNHPDSSAERLSQQTGIKVIAARDGMIFDLSQLNGK